MTDKPTLSVPKTADQIAEALHESGQEGGAQERTHRGHALLGSTTLDDVEEHFVDGVAPPRALMEYDDADLDGIDIADLEDIDPDNFLASIRKSRMPMILTNPRKPDNPIVFANPAFLELTGYKFKEIYNRNCRFLQGPDTSRETVRKIRSALENGNGVDAEVLNYRKDGTAFWNNLFISPIIKDGVVTYFFASQVDASFRHYAVEAIGRSAHMEALGQLTGGIAHDFNNLLTIIIGRAEMLDRYVKMPGLSAAIPKLTASLADLLKAAERGASLTRQLLTFARRQRLEPTALDLNDIISKVDGLARNAIRADDDIVMTSKLAPDIWLVKIDQLQTEMVFLNLIKNARDAMPNGGEIMISTENRVIGVKEASEIGYISPGSYVSLSVRDSGTGMPPEVRQRATEPFFTTKKLDQGTGLGLSMAYGFARQSNGAIVIESQVGKGTTVSMLFPIVREAPILPIQTSSTCILVVEDEISVASVAIDILSEAGYDVVHVESGEQALEALASQHIDMLFTDVMMPGGMNGIVLAGRVRELFPDMPILVTSGRTMFDHHHAAEGGYEIISKPYRMDELVLSVKYVLKGEKRPVISGARFDRLQA